MRCLIVADLHYSLPQYDWVVHVAERFDLVIMAGDHIDLSSPVDGRAQMVVIAKYLDLIGSKTKVITCSGNHDLDSRDSQGEKTSAWISALRATGVPTDDDTIEFGDTLITLCRWWDGPLAQARLAEQLARDAARAPAKWLWVHHAPAFDSPVSWSGSKSSGDAVLQGWINTYQPDMVFSGHIHQSPFTKAGSWIDRVGKTWVFNVGQHPGAPPAHIVFDSDQNEVVWMSMAGIQSVRLDQPLVRPLPRLPVPPAWVTSRDPAPGPSPDHRALPAG